MDTKAHWEHVYATKSPQEVSWTQEVPNTSLTFIDSINASKEASIIDIGGGDSRLVDHLLALGYQNITVLDISKNALERAKKRLGDRSQLVQWIEADITTWKPNERYDIWHDRAVFHFLTKEHDLQNYKKLIEHHVVGSIVLATFSTDGPLKCSGLEITQYNSQSFEHLFAPAFELKKYFYEAHSTPFDTVQKFIFGLFQRI